MLDWLIVQFWLLRWNVQIGIYTKTEITSVLIE